MIAEQAVNPFFLFGVEKRALSFFLYLGGGAGYSPNLCNFLTHHENILKNFLWKFF